MTMGHSGAQSRRGAWTGSERHNELPPNWSKIRQRILRRDDNSCQWPIPPAGVCGVEAREVDHRWNRDVHEDWNLWLLCRVHHNEKTQREAYAARVFEKRAPEAHPGLVDPRA